MNYKFLLLTIIVLIGNIIESITGFGSTITSVSLGAHLYSIHKLVIFLVPLGLLLSTYFVIRYPSYIEYSTLFFRILPLVIIGLPIGILIFNFVQSHLFKFAYGLFVLLFSVYELALTLSKQVDYKPRPLTPLKSTFFLILGGIVQGAYASGGPLIVYYVNRKISNKKNFRSTLSALWLILNIFLTINLIITKKINIESLKFSAALIPALLIGIVIGELLHFHISERKFRIFVLVILIIAGASLVIRF